MKQRVGIARAFALSPKLLLLDEPFGMLDSLTRWELQDVLMEVWTRTKVTAICVTHDVDEAILLADRVVMMSNGPNARIGNIMEVDLPRPRSRKALLAHPTTTPIARNCSISSKPMKAAPIPARSTEIHPRQARQRVLHARSGLRWKPRSKTDEKTQTRRHRQRHGAGPRCSKISSSGIPTPSTSPSSMPNRA